MNRRNFIVSSVMGAGALSMFPTSALASNNGISLEKIGSGFGRLLNNVNAISISNLSSGVAKTHQRLAIALNDSGYLYNATEVVQLSNSCYAIPLHKKPMLGFESKELALIVKHDGVSKFYILNEKLTNEFNGLIETFSQNLESHELNLDAASFAFPVKVVQQQQGRETIFAYQNKFNNTIALKSTRKKSEVHLS
ncbi:hypothetical protein [Kordia jejudonensis]|uniref:hypothetical protein n=1 Tax=Kordia jejudonensis TaxID=1348245 RepID=UPI0006294C45|nr:hypothetical protein [Kordia jejudonensis]